MPPTANSGRFGVVSRHPFDDAAWLLLGLTFALDSGSSLRYPAYQTTIGDLLPREQLANALVLASIGWNIARALGPGIGGLIIAVAGVPAAFAANALCNVYIIGVLLSWYWKSPLAKISNSNPSRFNKWLGWPGVLSALSS